MRRGLWRTVAVVGAALLWGPSPAAPTEENLPADLPFRPVVEANGVLYVSGHLPLLPGTRTLAGATVGPQTHQVLENVAGTLATAGASLDDVICVTVYLTTMEDFQEFNQAYRQHFSPPYPARTTVAVHELAFGSRIEVSCLAASNAAPPNAP